MLNVSRFEANLLRLLYYFLRREPIERALPLVEARCDAPKKLSEGAVRLVKDALAKGCTFLLAQRGGWRDERHLREEKPVSGRLWHRTPPEDLGLTFSKHTMDFLVWITAARPGDKDPKWGPAHDQLTHGDLLLLFFAHEGLRDTVEGLGAPTLRKRAPFMHHALCWLAYPEDFTQVPEDTKPRFDPWIKGVGACILEALQPELMARWIHVESSKERIEQPAVMRALGTSQERVLDAFLTAVEKANRRDLARFLLRAAEHLLGPHAHPGMWTGSLQMTGQRLADRAATYQAGVVLLRHMDRLASWTRWARSSGYLDEDYQAAQLWLSDWGAARLRLTDRSLNSLRAKGVSADMLQKLGGLKDRQFESQAKFQDEVGTALTGVAKARAQDELKRFEGTLSERTKGPAGVELTDKSLESLRAAAIPEKVLRTLVRLKHNRFEKPEELLDEVAMALAQDELNRVQDLVLEQASAEESSGDILVHRAQTIIRNLDPMRQAAQAQA